MKPLETNGESIEVEWDTFGISRVDFSSSWDGDLVNLYTVVYPQATEAETEELMRSCALQIARWILDNRSRFGSNDRFQIIIGWPLHVRKTGRQTIKTGGSDTELQGLVDGEISIVMRRAWSKGVFA